MYAGLPSTVTLTLPMFVGSCPVANAGALLQLTPAAGDVAGARFVPLITIHVFCAMPAPVAPSAVTTEPIDGPVLFMICATIPDKSVLGAPASSTTTIRVIGLVTYAR